MAQNRALGKKAVTNEQLAQMLRKNLLKRKQQQAGRQADVDANRNYTDYKAAKNSSVIK
ncbi:MAG: hypothetical protein FWF01_03175 [Alphaproteobacteria bacterium]|nr:hypothetical protein [Alphaproteobacteria bacterium]